eukprot:GEZU01010729.1.p1 GENE.GEZU01010729.1~~GEZU01010729.1.p1  ORF type:complete len:159 (-),score=33.72 GEZU01010729.1:332-808(-)
MVEELRRKDLLTILYYKLDHSQADEVSSFTKVPIIMSFSSSAEETLRADAKQYVRELPKSELRRLASACEETKTFLRLRKDPNLQEYVNEAAGLLYKLSADDMIEVFMKFDPHNLNHSALSSSYPLVPLRKQLLRRIQFMTVQEIKLLREKLVVCCFA